MKKVSFFMVIAVLTILLAGCGSDDNNANETTDSNADNTEVNENNENNEENASDTWVYQPEDINPDTDVCEICAMAVADDQYATQIVLENERSLKFDDLGCLYKWIEENGKDEIGASFVRDFHTEDWILLEDAYYVFDEEIETPMAYGIISFENQEDAESYMEENDLGELLMVEDLDEHKWQMMNHDHDHDNDHNDHDNHGEENDNHDNHDEE